MSIERMIVLAVGGLGLMSLRGKAEDIVLPGQASRATLVELYSSEGCSSCPPAEEWLSQLKDDSRLWKEIVPVAFHVDYWDGLGWPDRFARKAYTQRQSDYQASWNSTEVYTPEFIVDGHEWHRYFGSAGLPLAKGEAVGPLRVVVHREGWGVQVTHAGTSAPVTVNVAWLGIGVGSDVGAGENSGRKLVHDFVVLDFQSKPAVTNAGGISADFPAPIALPKDTRPEAIAVWISADDGSILQVTGGWLK